MKRYYPGTPHLLRAREAVFEMRKLDHADEGRALNRRFRAAQRFDALVKRGPNTKSRSANTRYCLRCMLDAIQRQKENEAEWRST